MKKILSLAIAAALVAPAAVMAEATSYGKAHMIIANTDDGNDDVWSVDSIDSRVGVKGSEDLGNGLKAVYQFEFGVDPDSGDTLSNRNQFVGLAGGFGTFLLGRHDTPLKMSQGKFDQFGDLPGDIKGVFPGEDRLSNVMAYVSPNMSGFSVIGAAVAGEQGDDAGELTGIADHLSLAGLYSNGPVFGSLAYNTYDLGSNADVDPSLIRATLIWKGGIWQAGFMYSSMDFDGAGDDADQMGVSGYLKVGSKGKIKAQYLTGDSPTTKVNKVLSALSAPADFDPNVKIVEPAANNEVEQWSVGYAHNMSKRTTLHAGYTAYEEDTGAKEDTFFVGMIHKF
jgi:predicted porin